MPASSDDLPRTCNYFVDEAGTPTLYARRRKPIVGEQGCSTLFILGKLDVADPEGLDKELADLRASLLADPYFAHVPSMRTERRKTFFAFHAKDDVPEVRRDVFNVLMRHDIKFSAVIRDKFAVLNEVQVRNLADPQYRYQENELYDTLVSDLFKSGFHEADHFRICFSRRAEKDRRQALAQALETARAHYDRTLGVSMGASTVEVLCAQPRDFGGLQAVDYFLWALHRALEAKEESDWRYWDFVQAKVRLVHDKDDTREHPFGAYYNPENPLTRESQAKNIRHSAKK